MLKLDENKIWDIKRNNPEISREQIEAMVWTDMFEEDPVINDLNSKLWIQKGYKHLRVGQLKNDHLALNRYVKKKDKEIKGYEEKLNRHISNNYPSFLFGHLKNMQSEWT